MVTRSVGIVYDQRMCAHENPSDPLHPETPARLTAIVDRLQSAGVLQRCVRVQAREATDEELATVHTKQHISLMQAVSSKAYGKEGRKGLARRYNSIYFNEGSSQSALLAAGSVVEISLQVARNDLEAGAAVVRPPGHHAEADDAMGFCMFNNVAVAAHVLIHRKPELGIQRILIVDWDVHHGNGTQQMFWNDPHVLYFSVHRYDNGLFYPAGEEGDYDKIGDGDGVGFNINVPWPHGGFGDADYLAVWDHLLIPVARKFNPDIVMISAGFDAAEGDPLGGCRLTPSGYLHMTHKLMDLAKGRVILALEGGYNLKSIADSYLACVQVLLGDEPVKDLFLPKPHMHTWSLLGKVRSELQKFWPVLSEGTEFFSTELLDATTALSMNLSALGLENENSSEEDEVSNRGTHWIADASGVSESIDTVEKPLVNVIEQIAQLTIEKSSDNGTDDDMYSKHTKMIEVDAVAEEGHQANEMYSEHTQMNEAGAVTQERHQANAINENSTSVLADVKQNILNSCFSEDKELVFPSLNKETTYVWYASYGSNLWKPRFMCYLEGGQVEGMARPCVGSKDHQAPVAADWLQLSHKLFFGQSNSLTWGPGGVAFLDLNRADDASTYVHLYKITLEQFNDLVMQENGVGSGSWCSMVDDNLINNLRKGLPSFPENSIELIKDCRYGMLLYLGEKDACPILTLTCSPSCLEMFKSGLLPVCPPSNRYSQIMVRGLVEHKNLSENEALAYISRLSCQGT